MKHKLKYSVVVDKGTGQLVDASEVRNGLKCNCICWHCKENLIAINNEKNSIIDHFRHISNTKCDANFESYIHWLTKEIFKTLPYIILPPISLGDLFSLNSAILPEIENVYNNYNIKPEIDHSIKIQEAKRLTLKNVKTEYTIRDIRADIVIIENEENTLIIEPYYSNPINEIKLAKIKSLDQTVLSLSLKEFMLSNNFIFTKESLKSFLMNDIYHKCWIYIRSTKTINLKKKLINKIENHLKEKSDLLSKRRFLINERRTHYKKVEKSENLIFKIKLNITNIKDEIEKLEDEIENINSKLKLK